jgi:hypothetical protein
VGGARVVPIQEETRVSEGGAHGVFPVEAGRGERRGKLLIGHKKFVIPYWLSKHSNFPVGH